VRHVFLPKKVFFSLFGDGLFTLAVVVMVESGAFQ